MPRLTSLGSLELEDAGESLLAGRRKPLALAVYLVRVGRAVSRERLAALLWGDRPIAQARQSLRQSLSDIRAALGDRLETEGESVLLPADRITLDANVFETDVAEGRWLAAVDRWRGDFLSGCEEFGDEEWRTWLEVERAALRKELAIAFDGATAECEGRADWKAGAALAREWAQRLPNDERAPVRWATLLKSAGQPSEALARLTEWSERYRRETDAVEPVEVTRLLRSLERRNTVVTPPGARALMSPDMVGRAEAFSRLANDWTRVRAGEARTALIDADEGLGKSRLISEFARVARERRDARVVEVRAYAVEQAQAWRTLRVAVAQLVVTPTLAAVDPQDLATLSRDVPELRERFRHLPESSGTASWSDALIRALRVIAAETPVALLIDDAPEADEESQRTIGELVRHPIGGLFLVLAGRPSAWRISTLRTETQRGLPQLDTLELQPLTESEVRVMLASMAPLGEADAMQLAGRVRQATGGYPAQIVHLFRHLADDGTLAPDGRGRWHLTRDPESLVVPSAIREAFAERLATLPPQVRTIVDVAAVLGPRIDLATLEAVTGLEPAVFQGAFGTVLESRLLRQTEPVAGSYEFASEANRRVAYDALAPSRRRQLHRAVVDILERDPIKGTEREFLLAHHRRRAGSMARTWRRRLLVTGVAAIAIAAVATFVITTPAARVSGGSPVLIADLENHSGDPIFDRALLTAATIALQQSRQVSVFPRQRIAQVLARMRRAGDSVIDEKTAREVAERASVPVVLSLGVAAFDSTYELTARLVEPVSGRTLAAESRRALGKGRVLDELDALMRRVRRDLGESRDSLAVDRRLPDVTTASLEALRAYSDALRAWARRDYESAGDGFGRAIALDSSFALALSSMADFAYISRNDRVAGGRYLDQALAGIEHLSEREQLVLRAKTEDYRGSPDEALRLRGLLAQRFPERDTWMTYGTTLMQNHRCREAIPALERAVTFDSTWPNPLINIATCYKNLGNEMAALRAYERAAAVDSLVLLSGNLNQEFGNTLVALGMLDSAAAMHRRMLARGDDESRWRAYRALGFLASHRGQLRAAMAFFDSATFASRSDPSPLPAFRNQVLYATAAAEFGNSAGIRAAASIPRAYTPDDYFAFCAGEVLARTGHVAWARAILDSLVSRNASPSADDLTLQALLRARIHLAEGRPDAARRDLDAARDSTRDGFRLSLLAETHAALQHPDSGLAIAESLGRQFHHGYEAAFPWLRATLQVARFALQLGDTARARQAYRTYADRSVDGDADLPGLREARRALNQLGGANAIRDAR